MSIPASQPFAACANPQPYDSDSDVESVAASTHTQMAVPTAAADASSDTAATTLFTALDERWSTLGTRMKPNDLPVAQLHAKPTNSSPSRNRSATDQPAEPGQSAKSTGGGRRDSPLRRRAKWEGSTREAVVPRSSASPRGAASDWVKPLPLPQSMSEGGSSENSEKIRKGSPSRWDVRLAAYGANAAAMATKARSSGRRQM